MATEPASMATSSSHLHEICQSPSLSGGFRNTAEPSGELSVGDIVSVGEVPLAVARVGWTLVRGGLNEVRADEHGTHPLPARSRLPDTADQGAT